MSSKRELYHRGKSAQGSRRRSRRDSDNRALGVIGYNEKIVRVINLRGGNRVNPFLR